MKTVAFFIHDERDAAIKRRVQAFQSAGHRVIGFSMRRTHRADYGWNVVDLGQTYDGSYLQRLAAIARGARRAAAAGDLLREADIIYARNLDTALCARISMLLAGVRAPFVYECLDIHRLMHRNDMVGAVMRMLERRILVNSSLLVVSSPAFLRNHFDIRHAGKFKARLVENRIAESPDLGERPLPAGAVARPLRIGWFGVLRCKRSLDLMEDLAERFKDKIEIVMAGYPDRELPHFHERIRKHPNMRFSGRYKSPEDLSSLYGRVDLVWAGDFHDAGFNSKWLLPNRIYEGGYFATPAIAPRDAETGQWVQAHGAGFTVEEPLERSLPELVSRLMRAPDDILAARNRLLHASRDVFVQPKHEMDDVLRAAVMNYESRRKTKETPRRTAPLDA